MIKSAIIKTNFELFISTMLVYRALFPIFFLTEFPSYYLGLKVFLEILQENLSPLI